MKQNYAPSLITVEHSSVPAIFSLNQRNRKAGEKSRREEVLVEQIARTEVWSTVVYFLKMAYNLDSAGGVEAPFSALYKIFVVQTFWCFDK